jgi:hypothetical protein
VLAAAPGLGHTVIHGGEVDSLLSDDQV